MSHLRTLLTIVLAASSPAWAAVSFEETLHEVGQKPFGVVAADLDGDGLTDLVSVDSFANAVSILRATRPGEFVAAGSYAVGKRPASAVAEDFDGDGDIDLAVANRLDDTLTVLYNDGAGAFTSVAAHAVGSRPTWVGAGDLDGDGHVDLVTANKQGGDLTVLASRANGAFEALAPVDTGRRPMAGRVRDLDDDGRDDVVVVNQLDDTVTVLRGSDGPGLVLSETLSVGREPRDVEIVDLDGDGWLDLAVTLRLEGAVAVLSGSPTGFGAPVAWPAGSSPARLAAGDFDGDCLPDLAVTGSGAGSISILSGDGTGGFAPGETVLGSASDPREVVRGDFDGDLRADLAVAGGGDNAIETYRNTADPVCTTFHVRRSLDPSTVREQAPLSTVYSGPYDDASGILSDGELHFYVIEHAGGLPVDLSAHANPAGDTVRVGFRDGDPQSAPVDHILTGLQASVATAPADGVATITVEITPRDGGGVALGTGLSLEVDAEALLPGELAGPVRDRGDGTYVANVVASQPGTGTVVVSVEGVVLESMPVVSFAAP